jgi:hypothetical protein
VLNPGRRDGLLRHGLGLVGLAAQDRSAGRIRSNDR